MNLRRTALFQPVNSTSHFFAQPLILDHLKRISVCVDGEYKGFCVGQTVECLSFTSKQRLYSRELYPRVTKCNKTG